MHISNTLKFVISLIIPMAIGAVAGIATSQSVSGWYETLNSPSFRPPNWVFGPVWTMLYLLMGVSLFLVWKEKKSAIRDRAIQIFGIQMVFNFAWSFIFFKFHLLGIALAEIIILWILIVAMILSFRKVKPVAAYINIPYLLWVSFATMLNAAYYWLN